MDELNDQSDAAVRSLEEGWRGGTLWILTELVNADKHRTLNLGTSFLYEPEIVFEPPDGAERLWVRSAGLFGDGDDLARHHLTEGFAEDQVKAHTKFGADIVFKDQGPSEGTKVDVMLAWLFDTVVHVVELFDYQALRRKTSGENNEVRGERQRNRDVPGRGGAPRHVGREAGAVGVTQEVPRRWPEAAIRLSRPRDHDSVVVSRAARTRRRLKWTVTLPHTQLR